jgi:hypothetical protein
MSGIYSGASPMEDDMQARMFLPASIALSVLVAGGIARTSTINILNLFKPLPKILPKK